MAVITNFPYKGRGRVWVGDDSSSELRELGDVSGAEFAFEVEEQELKDYRSCAGGLYASAVDISSGRVALVVHDLSPENFNMAFFGTSSAITEAAATEEVHTVPTTSARMLLTANTIKVGGTITVSSATAGGGTVYVAGTDYNVFPGGIEYLLTGSLSGGETVYVNFTKHAVSRVEALMSASLEKFLLVDGLNCAKSGAPVTIRVWKFQPSPSDAFQLISDDFASFNLNGKIAADTSKGASFSQYFQADIATSDA